MALNSYTAALKEADVEKLRQLLHERGFEFFEKQYAHYTAKKGKLNVTVYQKGPKVLIQGKETEDFVQFVLEPEILGEARLGNEEILMPEMFEPHFGVDESGKGDFFGPLVVAGVYVDKASARSLMDQGVMDSKLISSDVKIGKLAKLIRSTPGVVWEVIALRPEKYNELYTKFGNLNRMLAWGHARVIASLAEKVPSCPVALSDQFAREEVLQRALEQQGEVVAHIELQQRTKAESDVAVAAASILARESFVDWISRASERGGVTMPLGASSRVVEAARDIVEKHGSEILTKITKTHFKTTQQM
ncbi:ribonuclease HIII [Rubritalea profundi]|uniref:Ribonuclease n=1 Tax=Rubritalea profundi TaxID=1658618 RepID=A0A2S7TZZ7_9BACT|nr:ribonuclease HIII [Rubritalea profundi]PQJ27523.1 ribonuclease HIII [Rubritalea profundi]